MGLWTLTRRSLRHYLRANLALGFGVAVAVAVLVGSLLVGSSIQVSLRQLALERLGRTDYALTGERHFFGEELAERLSVHLAEPGGGCVPMIISPGSARVPTSKAAIGGVNVLGVTQGFAKLWPEEKRGRESFSRWLVGPSNESKKDSRPLFSKPGQVVINRTLADDLGVAAGDALIVSFGLSGEVSTDIVFGRRQRRDLVAGSRVTVASVIPARDAGRFSLQGDQTRPRNVIMPLASLQRLLKEPGRLNTLLVTSAGIGKPAEQAKLQAALASVMTLEDYGLHVRPSEKVKGAFFLTSDRVVLAPEVVSAARGAARRLRLSLTPISVYLANSLKKVGTDSPTIPYSIIAGLGFPGKAALGPDEIVLNRWAISRLSVKPDDRVETSFYIAGAKGKLQELTRQFKVLRVVKMDNPNVDAGLVPDFEGMTDAETMSDWNPPFPIDLARIGQPDEDYWQQYGVAPKAFVGPNVLRALWLHSRPDETNPAWLTGFRLGTSADNLTADMERFKSELLKGLTPEKAGLRLRPVKDEALASAKATQDFATLFLSMSMFLVASAVALIVLLVKLTVQQRARQIGIMLAVGFPHRAIRRVLFREATIVLLVATWVGIPMGVVYAGGIIAALGSFWSQAIGGFPLALHVSMGRPALGAACGFIVALVAVGLSVRGLDRLRAVKLLGGRQGSLSRTSERTRRLLNLVGLLALGVATLLCMLSLRLDWVPTQVAFFIGGAACMTGVVLLFGGRLARRTRAGTRAVRLTLLRLALRGASRNTLRSLLTVSLLACAAFIIVTVGTFGKNPSRMHPGPKTSGTGGFSLVVTTSVPIFQDLNTEEGRKQLGLSSNASEQLAGTKVFALRTSAGEDVSCLNIQKASVPRVLGVPNEMIGRGGFRFVAHRRVITQAIKKNPWILLKRPLPDGVVPAFADAATARWNLHVGLGDVIEVPRPDGTAVRLQLVGLLADSVFAGELLVSELDFVEHFGTDSGYRTLLLEMGPNAGNETQLMNALREELSDFGMDVMRSSDVLASFAQVQNTYLATFQTLGGLGLVLGTFGLVTVLVRNVLERRTELAMMLAVGFAQGRLVRMVLLENVMLLIVGVAAGTLAALVGTLPQLVKAQTEVQWIGLLTTLLLTLAVGTVSCALAARATLSGNLVEALRSE